MSKVYANWREALKPGDCILKDPGVGMFVYQRVVKMTRRPRDTRFVEAFSTLAPRGELGDTYIHDAVALISPELWKALQDAGFPASIPIPVRSETLERDGVRFPVWTIDTLRVN